MMMLKRRTLDIKRLVKNEEKNRRKWTKDKNIFVFLMQHLSYSSHPTLNIIRNEITKITVELCFFYKESSLLQIGKSTCCSESFLIFRDASTQFLIS